MSPQHPSNRHRYITLDTMNYPSEVVCAQRMYSIARGGSPLAESSYSVDEIAHRYGVTPDAVYRGIRLGSPLYPVATRDGNGPRAPLLITCEALEACDARRIEFYMTTPSWFKLDGRDWQKPPLRKSARALLGSAR